MTTLDAFNKFFQSDLEVSHTSDELALYMRLLHRANQLRKGRFNLAVDKLMMELGMKTKRPFDTARKGLREAGLIEFQNGNGRGCTTEYLLIGLDFQSEKVPERGTKNDPLSAPLSATIPHRKREENALLHKSKIKSKNKEANASTAAGKNSVSEPAENPAPALEPWAAWLAENAPDVQRWKEPLTAEQWTSLVADYDESLVQEVLQAMHNTAGAEKKYKSVSLTARNWCKRRCPTGKPKPAPKPATPKASPVNPEAIAENEARAAINLAAMQAEFQARQAAKQVAA